MSDIPSSPAWGEAAIGLQPEIRGYAVVLDGHVAVGHGVCRDIPVVGPAESEDARSITAGYRLLERLREGEAQAGGGQAVCRDAHERLGGVRGVGLLNLERKELVQIRGRLTDTSEVDSVAVELLEILAPG